MVTQITVKVGGMAGIDETELLRAELAEESGLTWKREPAPDDGHLGVGEFLLHTAMQLANGAPDAVIAAVAVDRVREVVKRWQDRWLDPPEIEVSTQGLTGRNRPFVFLSHPVGRRQAPPFA